MLSDFPEEMDEETERALVLKAKTGDRLAMETLISAQQNRVFRTAVSFTGNQEAAEEIAQTVLINTFRHLSKFRGDSRLSTWMYRMTLNTYKNYQISKGRLNSRFSSLDQPLSSDDEHFTLNPADPTASLKDVVSDRQMLELLRQRIQNLPQEYQEALILRYFEDLSYEEISDILEIPLGTIKSRISRGRRELKKLMSDEFHFDGKGES